MKNKGIFIALEGVDKAGKTTQAAKLREKLEFNGFKVAVTFEPGDTEFGKIIRKILLNTPDLKLDHMTRLLLFVAERNYHNRVKIIPWLSHYDFIICDRYIASTKLYQGIIGKIPASTINLVHKLTGVITPDKTYLLDISEKEYLARAIEGNVDAFEREMVANFNKMRNGYKKVLKEGKTCRFINCEKHGEDITEEIYLDIMKTFGNRVIKA